MSGRKLMLLAVACVLLASAAQAQVSFEGPLPTLSKVAAGYDFWQTVGSGATGYDFGNDPLPADFFCEGSRPFTGRINFEGVPLKTNPSGILGRTDTIIRRFDDAVFDKEGVGRTRIQIVSLSMVGSPVKTYCGTWDVSVGLDPRQSINDMVFTRTSDEGGTFHADLWVNAALEFRNRRSGEVRSVTRLLHLPTSQNTPFASGLRAARACPKPIGPVQGPVEVLPVFETNSSRFVELEPGLRVDATRTGCICQEGVCLPVFSWHEDCQPPPNDPVLLAICEQHFTTDPCDIPAYQGVAPGCEDEVVADHFRMQLRELKERGYLNEDVETALRKLTGADR